MKKCLLVIAMIGLVAAVNAQSSDANAKKVLDGVSSKFKTFKGVQANFTLQVEDAKGKVQGSKKGTVYMKGTKYRANHRAGGCHRG